MKNLFTYVLAVFAALVVILAVAFSTEFVARKKAEAQHEQCSKIMKACVRGQLYTKEKLNDCRADREKEPR